MGCGEAAHGARDKGMMDGNRQTSKQSPANRAARSRILKSGTVIAAVLAVGAAGGWFARGAIPKAAASSSPRAADSASGVCDAWSKAICARTGEESEGCAKAKGAASVLPGAACSAANADVDGTVAKLSAARASCDQLVAKVCADLGEKTQTCAMVREKTPSFPAERCKTMLEQYDGVLAELKGMEAENAPLSAELAQRQAAGDAPGFGPKDAKVTIVAYSDFECPYCARGADAVGKIKEKYGTKVRFVFRQLPLPMHQHAQLAAEAALAAHAQGKFWPFHDLLFQNQRDLERASLEKYAEKAGLDMTRFRKDLDDHTYASAVEADKKLATEARVSGTPSMFIGAERVANAIDFDALSKEIDAKLAAAP
jgi:protein-disulfide isomerase